MLKLMDPTIFPMPTSGLEKNTPMIPVMRPGIEIPVAMTKPPVTSWPDNNQSIKSICIIRRLLHDLLQDPLSAIANRDGTRYSLHKR